MQQRARGKRRTGYTYLDSSPRALRLSRPSTKAVDRVREPGTVKAQLLGKLGNAGYQRLIGELREAASE